MKCPICGVWTTVKLTKQMDGLVQRSRTCGNDHRFTTEERCVPAKPHGGARFRNMAAGEPSEVRGRGVQQDVRPSRGDHAPTARPQDGD